MLLLGGLLMFLGIHVVGVFSDFATAIRYPFELDYGEGIVWQQAELLPGPRMYSTSTDLPFIVFHYPPLYYLLVRVAHVILPDWLAAGRFVSAASTLPIAASTAALVLIATGRPGVARTPLEHGIAIAAGALILCLHAVRSWGMFMRVDMPAVALAMIGLLVASLSAGRFWGTTLALLLCGAAVFTKQTELPAGVAVFLIALLRNPRGALGAAAIAGSLCLAALVFLEVTTNGGFLLHIVGYNVNPMSLWHAFWPLWREKSSFPVILSTLVAAWFVAGSVLRRSTLRDAFTEFRRGDTATLCRALLLLSLVLLTLTTPELMKSGSNYNYFIEWLAVGCALCGIAVVDLMRGSPRPRWHWAGLATVTLLVVAVLPSRSLREAGAKSRIPWQEAVVQRIKAAPEPVASEDMVLLMRGGKPVVFEPVIASDLATAGRWDASPLIQMIRSHGFAFMITRDDQNGGSLFRNPIIDAAMREAYPNVEKVGPRLWLHMP
jgi:hypothetical protein